MKDLRKLAFDIAVILDTWADRPAFFEPHVAKELSDALYAELKKTGGVEDPMLKDQADDPA